jgi:hypothetical protein
MKMCKCFYELTVTNLSGEVVHTAEEYSGYSTDEELNWLEKLYPDYTVSAEYKIIDLPDL